MVTIPDVLEKSPGINSNFSEIKSPCSTSRIFGSHCPIKNNGIIFCR